jgi:Sec-independent protein translocase protein TatA
LKEVARTVTLSIRELKSAKKNGEFSKEEKKAMKAEVKATFKELKDEVKRTWKDNKA